MKITIKIKQKELKALMKKKPHGNEASDDNQLFEIITNCLCDNSKSLSGFLKSLHYSDEPSEQ